MGQSIRLADNERADDVQLIGVTISPTHPALGRELRNIPFLSNLPARILGVGRARHLPGPELGSVRLRAADSLLVAAEPAPIAALHENTNLIVEDTSHVRRFRRRRAPIAILTLLAVVICAAFGVLRVTVLALIGVGVVPMIVDFASPWLNTLSPFALVLALYFLTSILAETVTNNAVAVIITPVAIGLAQPTGTDPRMLITAVKFATSASFATPIGYQTNTMAYAAADYRFSDLVKIGVPMNIIVVLTTCVALNVLM